MKNKTKNRKLATGYSVSVIYVMRTGSYFKFLSKLFPLKGGCCLS